MISDYFSATFGSRTRVPIALSPPRALIDIKLNILLSILTTLMPCKMHQFPTLDDHRGVERTKKTGPVG